MPGLEQIPWLYDALMDWTEPFGIGRWRRRLLDGARGRVLEVGCGTGRNLPLYAEAESRVRSVVAFDPCLAVALRARQRAREQHPAPNPAPSSNPAMVLVADVEHLPFRADRFDTAVSSLVFCSVPDPARGLREIARVLAPGGTLRMMEHVRHEVPWRARIQDWVQPLWTRLSGGCRVNRPTEATVEAGPFRIDQATRRARGTMRLFVARPRPSEPPSPGSRP